MAIKLINKTNTTGATGEFPYGNIRDNDGTNNGTPVNKAVYADFHQFFAHMFEQAKKVLVTFDYNNQPENAYDGFQYFDAFRLAINGAWQDPVYTGTYIPDTVTPIRYRLLGMKNVTIKGKLHDATPNSVTTNETLFTLPVAYRPLYKSVFPCVCVVGSSIVIVEVNTDGTVNLRGDLIAATDNDSIYLDFQFTLD